MKPVSEQWHWSDQSHDPPELHGRWREKECLAQGTQVGRTGLIQLIQVWALVVLWSRNKRASVKKENGRTAVRSDLQIPRQQEEVFPLAQENPTASWHPECWWSLEGSSSAGMLCPLLLALPQTPREIFCTFLLNSQKFPDCESPSRISRHKDLKRFFLWFSETFLVFSSNYFIPFCTISMCFDLKSSSSWQEKCKEGAFITGMDQREPPFCDYKRSRSCVP